MVPHVSAHETLNIRSPNIPVRTLRKNEDVMMIPKTDFKIYPAPKANPKLLGRCLIFLRIRNKHEQMNSLLKSRDSQNPCLGGPSEGPLR